MPEQKPPKNFQEMLRKLQCSVHEDADLVFKMTEDEIDAFLAEEGIDPLPAIAKVRSIVESSAHANARADLQPPHFRKQFFRSMRHFWTHPSVRNLGTTDPIEFVSRRASEIVLEAMQSGWSGPPFDSAKLAELRGVKVVPNADVRDARIIPSDDRRYQIEFNPSKSDARVRFSIAHELAHTIFDDCWVAIRHRLSRLEQHDDDWQLEMLCNIAAAEFLMPITQFPDLRESEVNINTILKLRENYKVSAEAVLLRLVRLTEAPCSIFAASEREPGRFVLEYSVSSRAWPVSIPCGTLLPRETVLKGCTAFGYTAIGEEEWLPALGPLRIECVRISPFPDESVPRYVGVICPQSFRPVKTGRITILKGDATQPRGEGNKVIAHIVNDKTPNWGKGFAFAVRRKWPEVQEAFQSWVARNPHSLSLGNVFHSEVFDEQLTVFQMICQRGYGPSPSPRIRYAPLKTCLEQLVKFADEQNASIHMPPIGIGEAGGSWGFIQQIIDEVLCSRGKDVTVYELPGQQIPQLGLFDSPKT